METLNGELPISDLFGLGEAEKYLEVMANQDDSVITYDGGIIVSPIPSRPRFFGDADDHPFLVLTVLLIVFISSFSWGITGGFLHAVSVSLTIL